MYSIEISSTAREEIIDITSRAACALQANNWTDGALHMYCQHTTCGLTINEGADPDVRRDLMSFFREIAPNDHGWRHMEGNSDAHVRSSLLGVSLLVPVENKKLLLGRWQSIYLYEGDGPRTRRILLQFLTNR